MKNEGLWRLDMDEEMVAIKKNDIWGLAPFLYGWKPIIINGSSKQRLFQMEMLKSTKARLVSKRYSQVEGDRLW